MMFDLNHLSGVKLTQNGHYYAEGFDEYAGSFHDRACATPVTGPGSFGPGVVRERPRAIVP